MKRNHIFLMIILIIVFLGIFLAALSAYYPADNNNVALNASLNETLNVSSEGPFALSELINEIKTEDFFKGYDNETVKWMESLGDKYVFFSEDYYVIMDKDDADKIPSVFACDVNFYEIFSCEVLESHSLGNIEYPRDVLYVKNVNYIREVRRYIQILSNCLKFFL